MKITLSKRSVYHLKRIEEWGYIPDSYETMEDFVAYLIYAEYKWAERQLEKLERKEKFGTLRGRSAKRKFGVIETKSYPISKEKENG